MTITSFNYFILVVVAALIYYIVPKSIQWVELLVFSIVFYAFAATPYTFIYILISSVMAWGVTNGLESYRLRNGAFSENVFWKSLIYAVIVINIVLWFIFKGSAFIKSGQYFLGKLIPGINSIQLLELTAALGMGYYTLQIVGYIIDCYWGNVSAQRNLFKLLLFTCFFPQLVTGPISKYEQLTSLYEKHTLSYTNIVHGTQRILWGLFKKLVLAERVGIIVNGVWADFVTYGGLYTWVAFILYPIQLYADFSGCMDIVIGTAEIFDIKLVENFNNPFFSKSIQEFWQRWHISLGHWARDYVLYPVLKSKWMIKLGKKLKEKFGKKTGKFLVTAVGMFVLWMVLGIWHGSIKHVIGVSLWHWTILILEDLLTPFFEKFNAKYGFKTKSFGWNIFRCFRTYLIFAFGIVFFRASGPTQAVKFLKAMFTSFNASNWNPWIFFDGSILNIGICHNDLNVIFVSVIVLLIVGILREKYGYARIWMDEQPIVFRWIIYIILLFAVIIFGSYGSGYEASAFIYGDF